MKSYEESPHFKHRIYLIRHGETEWSKSGQHTGRTDIPLTPLGEKEAKLIANGLKDVSFKKVFISPLMRVQKTCELAGFRNKAELTNDLYEWNYGDYEGITTKEIRQTNPNWNLFDGGAPNGETLDQVAQRADHILQIASQIEGDVALFSSGHFSRILGARWLNQPPKLAQFLSLSTASISILGYEHEWRVIQSWNNTAHLFNNKH